MGVLFTKAEATTATTKNTPSAMRGRVRACEMTTLATASSTPVRISAPEMTNIAPMVIGAGFENTSITWSVGTKPRTTKSAAIPAAVTSGG